MSDLNEAGFSDRLKAGREQYVASNDGPEFIFSGEQQGSDGEEYLVQVFDDVFEIASRGDSHERWSLPMVITRAKDREIHDNEEQS